MRVLLCVVALQLQYLYDGSGREALQGTLDRLFRYAHGGGFGQVLQGDAGSQFDFT